MSYFVSIVNVGLLRQRQWFARFLEADINIYPTFSNINSPTFIGWGCKKSGIRAISLANKKGGDYLHLEDGFLRSIRLGVHKDKPLSLVMDPRGIYYDATQSSQLEQLILATNENSPLKDEAHKAMDLITQHELSKYNDAPDYTLPDLPAGLTHRILVVDQTKGDQSVLLGGGERYFSDILSRALEDNPNAQIIVKTHPDVLAGKKKGYLPLNALPKDLRIWLCAVECSPMHLLKQVDSVYVYTSQMGFEALMLNKKVYCFGLPWYAGWGLTTDYHCDINIIHQRRTQPRKLWQLFAAAYLEYSRYLDPNTQNSGTIFDLIHWLALNKKVRQQLNHNLHSDIYCIGMSLWKRTVIRPFLRSIKVPIHFIPSLDHLKKKTIPQKSTLLIWGSRNLSQIQELARNNDLFLWRMEDAFVRSIGLGSDLHQPLSLVIDKQGIYYDPHSNSDLEYLLQHQCFTSEQKEEANRYIQQVIEHGISKYNLGGSALTLKNQGKKTLLIPGQVEDDASIIFGSPQITNNVDLVKKVRQLNPEAYLIYKPHPDVLSGNRHHFSNINTIHEYVDSVVKDADIVACIKAVDEVHTMTSLTGFEALLQGKKVHCYGGPFYAGWGLTVDHYPLIHRTRKLTLNELTYALIFLYPYYILPGTKRIKGYTTPQVVLNWISAQKKNHPSPTDPSPFWLQRQIRKAKALLNSF